MTKLTILMLLISCSTIQAKSRNLETVPYVDLNRYLGKWYEIARFENSFQKGCTATTATYTKRRDGDIKVLNECRLNTPQGTKKSAIGRAWITNKHTNAKLKVQFFLRRFRIPLFSGNYWILELDPDYQYVLIGEPSRKYLWILSRTPKIDAYTYERLVEKAEELNFETSKLLKTIH